MTMQDVMAKLAQEADSMAVEELIERAQGAPEPGDAPGTVIQRPEAGHPLGTAIGDIQSAGWVTVWDKRTSEPSIVNRNMLATQLQKKDETGRSIFTTVQPKQLPARGTLLCMLHANSPNRKEWDKMGLPVCRKANLRTPLDVQGHMEHRHSREWAAIENLRTREIAAEEREVRRAIISQSRREPEQPKPVPVETWSEACPKGCGKVFTSNKAKGYAFNAARLHSRRCSAGVTSN